MLLAHALKRLCSSGDTPALQRFLASYPDAVTYKDDQGNTLLHFAAEAGDLQALLFLQTQKLPYLIATATRNDGAQPIHLAAANNHQSVVEWCLGHGALLNVIDVNGATPLHYAAQNGSLNVVQSITALGVDFDMQTNDGATPIFLAACNGHVPVVEHLFLMGAAVFVAPFSSCVHAAAQGGHTVLLQWLLARGSEPNITIGNGVSPLLVAAQKNRVAAMRVLLEAKADVNAVSENGSTALYVATSLGLFDAVSLLCDYSAALDIPASHDDSTALTVACKHADLQTALNLLKNKANPNPSRQGMMSPLHYAAANDSFSLCQSLVDQGANVLSRNIEGKYPIDMTNDSSIQQLLRFTAQVVSKYQQTRPFAK